MSCFKLIVLSFFVLTATHAEAFADRGPRDPTEGLHESGCGKDQTCVDKIDKFGGREVRDPTAFGTERADRVPDRTYHDDRGNHGTRHVGESKQCKDAKSNRNSTASTSIFQAAVPCGACIVSKGANFSECLSCGVAVGVGAWETARSQIDVSEACRPERTVEDARRGSPAGDGLPEF